MKNKYQILATRSEIAAYYGWEYGIKRANELLKELIQIRPYLYQVRALTPNAHTTKYQTEILANRIRGVVCAFKGKTTGALTYNPFVFVEKI